MRRNEESDDLTAPAEQLVSLSRERLGKMSARRHDELFLTLNVRRSRGLRRKRLALSFAAVLAAGALLFIGRHWVGSDRVEALSYSVQGGRVGPSGILEANGGTTEPSLRFSDGTKVVFLNGARGRVKSVGLHGARVALTGKADVSVVPAQGSQWLFDAGPFLITVTGTNFTAEWRDADGHLEVALRTGAISVTGPLSDRAITLRGGQRLIVSTRQKEVLIRDLNSRQDTSAASVAPRPIENSGSEPSETLRAEAPKAIPAVPEPPHRTASNWSAELAAGHFGTILEQAEQRGLELVLAEVSSAELAALSDAARYSRRDEVARRALTAQRRRFPRSARANDAAFLLGRLEETAQHPELALAWYQRCLDESPHGTYLSEALGRKMTLVQRLHGAARARPIAEEYLRRFGNGTYASAARALIRAP
jgi:hypothetical protein